MARGILPGQPEADRRAGAHQELSRLRDLSADTNRVDYRAARVRQRDQKDLLDLSKAPRSAGQRIEARRLARRIASRVHVRMGADSRTAPRAGLARVRKA